MATINGNYREFRLDNGLLVALQETPTQTVSGRLRVWHGALNENLGEEGIAHFLEHALVTGGSNRYSVQESTEVHGILGYFNATTRRDTTSFKGSMLTEHVPLFIDYVSDTVFNPHFEKKVLKKKDKES